MDVSRPKECEHSKVRPEFDEKAARGLDPSEVRRRWPRAYVKCPDCGYEGILYASWAHYIFGDY